MEYKRITSKNNQTVTECAKLLLKKYRVSSGLFMIEGYKLTREAIQAGMEAKYVFFDEEKIKPGDDFFSEVVNFFGTETEVFLTTNEVLQKICGENSPEGVICILKHIDKIKKIIKINTSMSVSYPVMIFDGIRDPGNLGTIVRTSLAFGIKEIFISPDCADLYSLKTLRGSMGAMFYQKINVCDTKEVICSLKEQGYRVHAAALHQKSKNVWDVQIDDKTAFVIGNEANGLDDEILSLCTDCVIIPMGEHSESLNASVSSAVFMWEISKYTNFKRN